MRIAIIAHSMDRQKAGIFQYTHHLVRAMIRNRGEHEIFVFKDWYDPTLEGCTQIIIEPSALGIIKDAFRVFAIIPYYIRKHQIDLTLEPAHFGPFNLPKSVLRVTMIHDMTVFLMPHYHDHLSQLMQRQFLPGVLHRSNLILTNSNNTARDVIAYFPKTKAKVETIYLGRDPEYFPDTSRNLIEELGVDGPFFHYLGTIEPRKDLPTLLSAYENVRKSIHHLKPKLIIAGADGWKTETFYRDLDQHPYRKDIIVPGYITKPLARQLHTNSIAMIYPSIYEGFGFPVLEALSCGGKVITTSNSSLPEVGGDLAIYFETGNDRALSNAMKKILNEPLDKNYSVRAQSWAQKFTWDRYTDHLYEKFTKL